MGRNIELKARCGDLNRVREAARAVGASFSGVLEQTDIYFHTPAGRLKLREIAGGRAELIRYERPNSAGVRASDYTVEPVNDPAGLLASLSARLGVRGRVIKRRELWMYQNVRIHLDDVHGLGTFVEFEAVLADDEPDDAGHAKVRYLREAMGIGDGDLLGGSYGEMVNSDSGS